MNNTFARRLRAAEAAMMYNVDLMPSSPRWRLKEVSARWLRLGEDEARQLFPGLREGIEMLDWPFVTSLLP